LDADSNGLTWAARLTDVAIITAAAFGAAWYFTTVEWRTTFWGFPLDDAWIHLQFARNLGHGLGFSYNPGILVAGSTAPLWTLVLAIPAALRLNPIVSTKIIGVLLTIVAALVTGEVVRWLSGSRAAGLYTALVLALSPRMTWGSLSGMEVGLYAALSVGTLLAYLRALESGRPWWGLLAGLAGTARPETFVLFPILAVDWTIRSMRGRLPPPRFLTFIEPIGLFLVPVAAFVALNYASSGHPLPLTFYAKTYGMGTLPSLMEGRWHDALRDARWYPFEFLFQLLAWCEKEFPDLGLGALIGACALLGLTGGTADRRQGAYLVLVVLIASPMLKGLGAPEPPLMVHDGRYLFHLLAFFVIIAVVGMLELKRFVRPGWVIALFMALAVARLGFALFDGAADYAAKVKNINDLQIATARWIDKVTTPDARIATNDIGAIAYFSGRFIIDTEGLVTPEAIHPKRMRKFVPFLESERPDLLVIFPEWYPEIVARTDLFHEVYRIHAEQEAAGAPSLVMYRTPWTRASAAPGLVQ
jgi:arabinofuranosyltransferase